uniref:Uncharacterized protein n=1 Tax=Anopheles melas TaxID=34690 RepID=A0A182U043_9DIPT
MHGSIHGQTSRVSGCAYPCRCVPSCVQPLEPELTNGLEPDTVIRVSQTKLTSVVPSASIQSPVDRRYKRMATTGSDTFYIAGTKRHTGNCAPLWDVYNPDWLPSLFIPTQTREPVDASTIESCKEFLRHEQLTEESIANPLLDQRPDHSVLRTLLIDEIIAYPIGRTYFLLDDESDHSTRSTYSARQLAKELKKCISRSTPIGRMVLERNAPDYPERMFSSDSTVTQLDLSVPPRWEMEKTIMTMQHSVLELLNRLD